VSGAILPRHIEIEYPSAQLTMKIDIADLQVNTLGPQSAALWTKPQYAGYPDRNLADPSVFAQPGGLQAPASSTISPGVQVNPPTSPPPSFMPPPAGPTTGAIQAAPTGYRSPRFAPYP
jgi:hypothetical protein